MSDQPQSGSAPMASGSSRGSLPSVLRVRDGSPTQIEDEHGVIVATVWHHFPGIWEDRVLRASEEAEAIACEIVERYNSPRLLAQDVGAQSFVRRFHTIPLDDEEVHEAQISCWCHPTKTEPWLWVHHAKDCREAMERQGKPTGRLWINIAERYNSPRCDETGDGPPSLEWEDIEEDEDRPF